MRQLCYLLYPGHDPALISQPCVCYCVCTCHCVLLCVLLCVYLSLCAAVCATVCVLVTVCCCVSDVYTHIEHTVCHKKQCLKVSFLYFAEQNYK